MFTDRQRLQITFLIPTLLFYGLALCLPVFEFEHQHAINGIVVLAWGWWGLLTLNAGWVANIFYLTACRQFFNAQNDRAKTSALIACGLALNAFLVTDWYFDEGSGTPVQAFGPGFWLWQSAMVSLLIGIVVYQRLNGVAHAG